METNENTKSQKKVAIPIVAIIVVILAVIVGYFAIIRLPAKQVEKIVSTAISELKEGNLETTKEFLKSNDEYKDLAGILDNIESGSNNGNIENIFFKHLQYKIVKSEANFTKAKVTVEVTNKNLGKAFSNYVREAAKLAFRSAFSDEYSDKDIENKLVEYLENEVNSEELETVTNIITIEAKKENGQWKLVTDSRAIMDALLPGLLERIESIQKSFEELEGTKTEETQNGEVTNNNNQENNTNNPDKSINNNENNNRNNNANEGNTNVQENNVEGGNTSIL